MINKIKKLAKALELTEDAIAALDDAGYTGVAGRLDHVANSILRIHNGLIDRLEGLEGGGK